MGDRRILVPAIFISNIPSRWPRRGDEPRRARRAATPRAEVAGATQALAAGAILVMLVDAMVREAVRDGGTPVGLITVLVFAVAVLISQA